jgi:hypothetical protein
VQGAHVANVNQLFGFLPIGRDGGGPLAPQMYCKVAAHTQALFCGDIVSKAAVSAPAHDSGINVQGCTSLQNGTPGTTLWLGSNLNYGAPATISFHWVFDTPDTVYIGQSSDNTSLTNAADAGKDAPFTTGAGNATTQKSTMGFTGGSVGTGISGCDIRLLRLFQKVGNAEGAYAIFEVMLLKSAKAQGSAGT